MNYIKNFIEFYREKVPKLIRMALSVIVGIVLVLLMLDASMRVDNKMGATYSTHDRVAIESPYDFDDNIFYDPGANISIAHYSNTSDINNAIYNFYEQTGVQLYIDYFEFDSEWVGDNFANNLEIEEYCKDAIKKRYGDKLDYSVVIWRTNLVHVYPENPKDKYDYESYGVYNYQYYYGSQTKQVFDAEGRAILSEGFSKVINSYASQEIKNRMFNISEELMYAHGKRVAQMKKCQLGASILAGVGTLLVVYVILKKKRDEQENEMVRILNTPTKTLAEQELLEAESRYNDEKDKMQI